MRKNFRLWHLLRDMALTSSLLLAGGCDRDELNLRSGDEHGDGPEESTLLTADAASAVTLPRIAMVGHIASDANRCEAPLLASDVAIASEACLASFTGNAPSAKDLQLLYANGSSTRMAHIKAVVPVKSGVVILQLKNSLGLNRELELDSLLPSADFCSALAASGDLSQLDVNLAEDKERSLPGIDCAGGLSSGSWTQKTSLAPDGTSLQLDEAATAKLRASDVVFLRQASIAGQPPPVVAMVTDVSQGHLVNLCSFRAEFQQYLTTRKAAKRTGGSPPNICSDVSTRLNPASPSSARAKWEPEFSFSVKSSKALLKVLLLQRGDTPATPLGSCADKLLKATKKATPSCSGSTTLPSCPGDTYKFAAIFSSARPTALALRKTIVNTTPNCGVPQLVVAPPTEPVLVKPGQTAKVYLQVSNNGSDAALAIRSAVTSKDPDSTTSAKITDTCGTLDVGKSCKLTVSVPWDASRSTQVFTVTVSYSNRSLEGLSASTDFTVTYQTPVTSVDVKLLTNANSRIPAGGFLPVSYSVTNTSAVDISNLAINLTETIGGITSTPILEANTCTGTIKRKASCKITLRAVWPGSGAGNTVGIAIGDEQAVSPTIFIGAPLSSGFSLDGPASTQQVPYFGSKLVQLHLEAKAGPLSVVDVSLSSPLAGVSLDASKCQGQVLQPGGSCAIYVTVNWVAGAGGGAVNVQATVKAGQGTALESATNAFRFTYTDSTIAQSLQWSPLPAGFSLPPRLTPSDPVALTLSNLAPTAVRIEKLVVEPATSASLTRNDCEGATLAPGAVCGFALSFQWSADAPPQSSVTVAALVGTDGGAPQSVVNVYNYAIQPLQAALALKFAEPHLVVVEDLRIFNFTVTNNGNAPVSPTPDLEGAVTASRGGAVSLDPATCSSIVPGGSCSGTLTMIDYPYWLSLGGQSQTLSMSADFAPLAGPSTRVVGAKTVTLNPPVAVITLLDAMPSYYCREGGLDYRSMVRVVNTSAGDAKNVRYYLAPATDPDRRFELTPVVGGSCAQDIASGAVCDLELTIIDASQLISLSRGDVMLVADYDNGRQRVASFSKILPAPIIPVRVQPSAHYVWEYEGGSIPEPLQLINESSCVLNLDWIVLRRALTISNQDIELERFIGGAVTLPAGPGATIDVGFDNSARFWPDYAAVAFAVAGRLNGAPFYSPTSEFSTGIRRQAGEIFAKTASWLVDVNAGGEIFLQVSNGAGETAGFVHHPRLIWFDADTAGPTYFSMSENLCEGKILAPAARSSIDRPNACAMRLRMHAPEAMLAGQTKRAVLEFVYNDDSGLEHRKRYLLILRFPSPLRAVALGQSEEVTTFLAGQSKTLLYSFTNTGTANLFLGMQRLAPFSDWQPASGCPSLLAPGSSCTLSISHAFPGPTNDAPPGNAAYELQYGFASNSSATLTLALPFRYVVYPSPSQVSGLNIWQSCSETGDSVLLAKSFGITYAFGDDGWLNQTGQLYADSACRVPLSNTQGKQLLGDNTASDFEASDRADLSKAITFRARYELVNGQPFQDGQIFELNIAIDAGGPGGNSPVYREWAWIKGDGTLRLSRGYCEGGDTYCPLDGLAPSSSRPSRDVLSQDINPDIPGSGFMSFNRPSVRLGGN